MEVPEASLLERSRRLVEALTPFRRLEEVRSSPEGVQLLARAHDLLTTVRRREVEAPPGADLDAPAPGPATGPHRVRLVHWNVEHGNRFEAILEALAHHPDLAGADVVTLNETDLGMARSGNHDVAFELAGALRFKAVWTPLFLELTAGRHGDAERAAGRPNREALFGLALLSRHRLGRAWQIALPSPEEIHFRRERMLGRHVALAAEVLHPGGAFVAVSTHLEVQRGPAQRRPQVRALVRALAEEGRPVVLAGDLNSTTFRRGRPWDPLAGLAALMLTPGAALRRRLLRPDLPAAAPREPLFLELARAGFRWQPYNDFAPTLRLRFERLGEIEELPGPLGRATLRAAARLSGRAQLRLDWVAARGFGEGRARTIAGLDQGPDQASDHAPIVAELELPGR